MNKEETLRTAAAEAGVSIRSTLFDILHIQDKHAPSVRPDDQLIFPRMDHKVVHGRCG